MPRAGHPAGENRPPPRSAQRPVDVSRTRWQARHRHQPHGSLPSLRGRTILVVDDDPDALELLHLILESCGAKVLAASTPMHARGYLQTVTPDLIVCDLLMPREDGLTPLRGGPGLAGRRGRARARHRGDGVLRGLPPSQAQEFSAYLQKPIDIDALTRTIAALLA